MMKDCGRKRTHDLARDCQCEACEVWWCENTKGYAICPRCREVTLKTLFCGLTCELCADDIIEDEIEAMHEADMPAMVSGSQGHALRFDGIRLHNDYATDIER